MKRAPDYLTKMIEPVVSGMGYECVGVEYVSSGVHSVLRVFIDSDGGIQVNDCAKVSHQLSGFLDVDEPPIKGKYQLEVSSPGIERPLVKVEDFDRFSGQSVEVQLFDLFDGQRKFRGLLEGARGEFVCVVADGRTNEIPLNLIKKAFLIHGTSGLKEGQRNGK
ncbi:MAG: ribosome maturation factor RimP [Methylococcales bacterium]|jgi:ribosome maturation factor RimP|nr:ribosome maturation factor RimP [Methylococcales bacterium]